MNNAYAMSATLEARKNTQASAITAGFAAFIILLMFLLKWKLPVFEQPPVEPDMLVELNLPEEPQVVAGGGGGGGNPVQASGPQGTASTPPAPGTEEESKDFEDDNDNAAPAVTKPVVAKPTATKINNNTSPVKTAKPVEEPPAPAKPKAVLGRTTAGSNTGGGAAENYDRSGGTGNGSGVGNGNGTGGGSGTGSGGGNGPGLGRGNGPSRVSGSRTVLSPKPMNAGENLEGRIRAEIRVSPDGVGTFIRGTGGSLMSNRDAIEIVKDWLRRNRFNKSDETTTEVYDFNIKMGG